MQVEAAEKVATEVACKSIHDLQGALLEAVQAEGAKQDGLRASQRDQSTVRNRSSRAAVQPSMASRSEYLPFSGPSRTII